MHDRKDEIPQAHATTCSWIFQKEALGFVDWASDRDGMDYWVALRTTSG